MHGLDPHDEIVVEELPRICPIGTDTTDHCCQVNHDIRLDIFLHANNSILLPQVILLATGGEDPATPIPLPQPFHHEGIQEARSIRDGDPLTLHFQTSRNALSTRNNTCASDDGKSLPIGPSLGGLP